MISIDQIYHYFFNPTVATAVLGGVWGVYVYYQYIMEKSPRERVRGFSAFIDMLQVGLLFGVFLSQFVQIIPCAIFTSTFAWVGMKMIGESPVPPCQPPTDPWAPVENPVSLIGPVNNLHKIISLIDGVEDISVDKRTVIFNYRRLVECHATVIVQDDIGTRVIITTSDHPVYCGKFHHSAIEEWLHNNF